MEKLENHSIVVPGQRIRQDEGFFISGDGTYKEGGFIVSSILGLVFIPRIGTITVRHFKESRTVPVVGDIVVAKVESLKAGKVKCTILGVGCIQYFNKEFLGEIDLDNIRNDKTTVYDVMKCYSEDDIILAKVIEINKSNKYLLSSKDDQCGVIVSLNKYNLPMTSINWTSMDRPGFNDLRHKKVARVSTESIETIFDVKRLRQILPDLFLSQ